MIVFKRLVKTGFTNFFRNIWLSLAATSIMAITLFIISTILVLYTLTDLSVRNIQDKVGITAYFKNQISEREILNIQAEIQLMPGVKSAEYIPNTLAREQFMELHKDEPLLLETLNEFKDSENPLPNSLAIKAESLRDYSLISAWLSEEFAPYFERVRDNSVVIDRLYKITNTITQLGILLTAVFVVVTVMVMFNTIRLTIYNRREEVEIMRLVGATNWYIRGPFIIEGIMYGLLATVITSGLMYFLLLLTTSRVEQFLSLTDIGGSMVNGLMPQILAANLTLSLGLGIIASSIAIRRYLRI